MHIKDTDFPGESQKSLADNLKEHFIIISCLRKNLNVFPNFRDRLYACQENTHLHKKTVFFLTPQASNLDFSHQTHEFTRKYYIKSYIENVRVK